ncbi:sialidase-3-like isoform X1 [Ascaphus truei]|uniref:sialidase-3-like isoform X1 n=1 Tax=Ascaphus truei TaxID=8439 RepID=UPI003F5A9FF1
MELAMTSALPERTTLFEKDSHGPVYRIPSLLYVKEETVFLAFAEKRRNEADVSAEYLVMRRGVYKTGDVKWKDIKILREAAMKGHRTMNPCPVYEENGNMVFLFFNCIPIGITEGEMKEKSICPKLCYITSGDCGKTWSSITDMIELVEGIRHISSLPLATFFLAPGHGIQTLSGKLIIPTYAYVISMTGSRDAKSFYLYSEDQGRSWHKSKLIDAKYETGECELAEIVCEASKKIYCNARSTCGRRVEAISLNVGGEYESVEKCEELMEVEKGGGCQGSIISFLGEEQPEQECSYWLLFSHPSKETRDNLGVYLNKSPLLSRSWSEPWVIYHGPSAYSDLAVCKNAEDDTMFALLFESGEKSPYENIHFCLFSLKNVLENIKGGFSGDII